MKQILIFLIFALPFSAAAQCSMEEYQNLLKESKTAQKKGQYDLAINKLFSARVCRPEKDEEIKGEILEVFREVNQQREIAIFEKDKAEIKTRENYANNLAFKSQVALEHGARSIAFRIAEFAHIYVDDENSNVDRALVEALYYNDIPYHNSLPWQWSLEGHSKDINSIAFSPTGKRLATGSADGTAKIWDLELGEQILTLKGDADVTFVAYSPDGKMLATRYADGTATIWDLESGTLTLTLKGDTRKVNFCRFWDGSKKLITRTQDDTINIWDLELQTVVISHPNMSGLISPDGKRLVDLIYESEGYIVISDLDTTNFNLIIPGEFVHNPGKLTLTFSPDSKFFAMVSSLGGIIDVWDLEHKELIATFNRHKDYCDYCTVNDIAFAPDGSSLATWWEDGIIKIWDMVNGEEKLTLGEITHDASNGTYSPSGESIAAIEYNTVKIWDLADVTDNWNEKNLENENTEIIEDFQNKIEETIVNGYISSFPNIVYSPNGKSVALGSEISMDNKTAVKILDLETGKVILTLEVFDVISKIAFSPDCKSIATGSEEGIVKIWNLKSGKAVYTFQTPRGYNYGVNDITFSIDCKAITTVDVNGIKQIWLLDAGSIIREVHSKRRLPTLLFPQIEQYDLEYLLEIRPENEQLLINSRDTWQIAAFAELYTNKIRQTGLPKKEDYERALRLYDYCAKSGEAPEYFAQRVEELKKVWKEKTE